MSEHDPNENGPAVDYDLLRAKTAEFITVVHTLCNYVPADGSLVAVKHFSRDNAPSLQLQAKSSSDPILACDESNYSAAVARNIVDEVRRCEPVGLPYGKYTINTLAYASRGQSTIISNTSYVRHRFFGKEKAVVVVEPAPLETIDQYIAWIVDAVKQDERRKTPIKDPRSGHAN